MTEKDRLTLPARLGNRRVLVSKVQVWPGSRGLFSKLAHHCLDTITVEPRTGEVNATPTYGAGATLTPCMVVHENTRYRDNQGNTLVGEGYVIMAPDASGTECLQVIYG